MQGVYGISRFVIETLHDESGFLVQLELHQVTGKPFASKSFPELNIVLKWTCFWGVRNITEEKRSMDLLPGVNFATCTEMRPNHNI